MYEFVDTRSVAPDFKKLETEINRTLSAMPENESKPEEMKSLKESLLKLFHTLKEEAYQGQSFKDSEEYLRFLIQMELGDISTASNRQLGAKLQQQFSEVESKSHDLQISCGNSADEGSSREPSSEAPPVDLPGEGHSTPEEQSRTVFGMKFAMATAYQTCDSLRLPAITANTDDVVGIAKGRDVGGGFARHYASISDIQRTHYYIRNVNYESGCFQVKNQPLVYDFGGAPKVESNTLNMFKNAGIGGTALGIDCSAFMSTGFAAAGLRYTPNVANKAIFVRQVSGQFINPVASGWKCWDRISMNGEDSLHAGDVMAVQGHVVMIDSVGRDPFGLNKIKSQNDCSNVSSRNFDFVIMQSSPSKSSIGINRYVARDYLDEGVKMKAGFEKYAYYACLAKFQNKKFTLNDSAVGIIRHKGTASCMAPRMKLANQSCIEKCFQ